MLCNGLRVQNLVSFLLLLFIFSSLLHSLDYFRFIFPFPNGQGYIPDASLRRLIQRFRNISKRYDLKVSETSPGISSKGVFSETSLKSFRFSQRRLWVSSVTVILGLETNVFFGYLFIYQRIIIFFAKLNYYRKYFLNKTSLICRNVPTIGEN